MTCSAKELRKTIASSMFPRFVVGAALAGASMLAQAGPFFNCVSGTAKDCTTAQSTLSWAWDGQDFTIFNSGAGYVSEVYFDLGSGMSAAFYGGTGVVNFMAGAHPASLPGGMGIGFSSDASFDSDAPGGSGYGIDNGESATFRILAATLGSVDIGDLAAGVHVRGLATGGASLVSTSATATAVPEPASIGLAAIGLGLLAWLTRRTRILPVTGR